MIWLSEIILQQTRVAQGMPYFIRFSEQYPTVKSFSEASEDDILRLWQGLGYYSRGRNMLKTAKVVQQEFDGKFPTNYQDLIKLTGIGEYTAAAISSFSANEANAVVDGNVYRLLARYFGIDTPINSGKGKKQFQAVADELLNPKAAAEHNQAIIEFGALQCKPKNPNCEPCPFVHSCFAFQSKKINELPVKLNKLKIRERYFYFFLIVKEDQILLKRRGNEDIWAGLHDLPSIEFAEKTPVKQLNEHPEFKAWLSKGATIQTVSDQIKHILTHQRIIARFVQVENFNDEDIAAKGWFWVQKDELKNYGQPKLIIEFLKNFYKFS